MTQSDEHWGTDLRLLRNLERQNDRDRGRDMSTTQRPETGRVDLERLSGGDNLKQALLLRFLTPVGALSHLGHPNYGSRLFELIGERNTPTNRNRAKMFVLQTLAQEPRVAEVARVEVTTDRTERTRINVAVNLIAIDTDTPLNLVFSFPLEGV